VRALVEEAIRQYLEAAAITDVDAATSPRRKPRWWVSYPVSLIGRPATREAQE